VRTARPGSLLRLRGDALRRVEQVTFVGRPGRRDDVTVPAAQATPRSPAACGCAPPRASSRGRARP
jgi:hypothetical protein